MLSSFHSGRLHQLLVQKKHVASKWSTLLFNHYLITGTAIIVLEDTDKSVPLFKNMSCFFSEIKYSSLIFCPVLYVFTLWSCEPAISVNSSYLCPLRVPVWQQWSQKGSKPSTTAEPKVISERCAFYKKPYWILFWLLSDGLPSDSLPGENQFLLFSSDSWRCGSHVWSHVLL